MLVPNNNRPQGWFAQKWAKLFGQTDTVERRLADLERQGSSMSKLAHSVAFVMIVLFSAGSLVALSGEALSQLLVEWNRGTIYVPAAISVGVSTILVLCCDTGMLYAALMVRLLKSRRTTEGLRLHYAIIISVALVESGTYCYMSAIYEQPNSVPAWALIVARAIMAPVLSIYLTMARPLPVTPRDILYQAEFLAGKGVLRDVVIRADDTTAPLADKMRLYNAAAVMTPDDSTRLQNMIQAVEAPSSRPLIVDADTPPTGLPPAGGDDPSASNVLRFPSARDVTEPLIDRVETLLIGNPNLSVENIMAATGAEKVAVKRAIATIVQRHFQSASAAAKRKSAEQAAQ